MASELETFLRGAAQQRKLRRQPAPAPDLVPLPPVVAAAATPGQLGHSREFTASAEKLGATVNLADDKMAAHLHSVFDHQLGSIRRTQVLAGVQAGSLAKTIRSALTTPDSIRQAFILSEVLQRPLDRW